MKKKIKSEKGAIAALVVVTVLMFALILMGTYMAITNLRKSQLESDIRIQQLYGGDVDRIEEVYSTVAKNITGGLEVGDYIEYNSGTNGTILCRVLYAPNSEYGLQIISDKNVKNITLGGSTFEEGRTSYNNAIETLNNEAEKYINTNYVTDARCVGSLSTVDENGIFVDKDKGTQTTVKLPPWVPEGEDSSVWWTDYTRPSGWISDDTGCYNEDENYKMDINQMELGNMLNIQENYWLASRDVNPHTSYCHWNIRVIQEDGLRNSFIVCAISSKGGISLLTNEAGLRPCFSLKTDIKITGGDGSQETPYTME